MKTQNLQLSAWAGMLASVLFVLVFTLEGWLRPGYNPWAMHISALSLGPRGWIQIANFIFLGLLLLIFLRGIATMFPTGKASRGGFYLFAVIAILFIISGIFVMDPSGTPTSQATVHGLIHGLAGGLIFMLMPVTIFVYYRRFRVDPAWQPFRGWTLALGIIEAAAVLVFIIVSKTPVPPPEVANWIGLIQRTALVPFMVWVFLFAWNLRQNVRMRVPEQLQVS